MVSDKRRNKFVSWLSRTTLWGALVLISNMLTQSYRGTWIERKRSMLCSWQNFYEEIFCVELGIRKLDYDLEAPLLSFPLLRPLDCSQRIWILICENFLLACWYTLRLCPYLCSISEFFSWMFCRRHQDLV